MTAEAKAAADTYLATRRCPDCGGQLYVTEAVVSEVHVGVVFVGRELERRERACVVVACSGCEFTREVR